MELNENNNSKEFRSGFVSIVGRPNVGKSTLLNMFVGQKIAAVSDKPNTTRNRIVGIRTLSGAQLVFLDTPGIHKAKGKLGKSMVKIALGAITEADVILILIEVKEPFGKDYRYIIDNLHKPAILVINKIDKISRAEILDIMSNSQQFGEKLLEVIPISATKGDGVVDLLNTIEGYLPVGPRHFPEDMLTDQPERFVAAELIREKIFNLTHKEIPYKTAVAIEEFKDVPKKSLVRISAVIYVERKSHKGILIGQAGQMLKQIGSLARIDIERILGAKVYLELWVKVREKWTQRGEHIREFGYGS